MNSLHTQLVVDRYQELVREAEHYRLAAQLPHHNATRHAIAQFGVLLVKIGMRLKQVELHSELQAA
ncbi:MAG TPA: hypothetical protein VKR06_12830 [Ktedonosporobacter sp.]|nr:hypothetical protein [Ktedonosporobacter sp.]